MFETISVHQLNVLDSAGQVGIELGVSEFADGNPQPTILLYGSRVDNATKIYASPWGSIIFKHSDGTFACFVEDNLGICELSPETGFLAIRDDARLSGPASDFAKVAESVRESVVCIKVRDATTWYKCSAGFYVDEIGTVLTASHVVEIEGVDVEQIEVVSSDGGNWTYRVKSELRHLDAVLLVPQDVRVQSVPVRVAQSHELGESVLALGYPYNVIEDDIQTATQGVIGAGAVWGSQTAGVRYIITDLVSDIGGSGGPLFNRNGEVVGFVDFQGTEDSFLYAVDITGESFGGN